MGRSNLQTFARYYDQIYLQRKDYESESKVVEHIIRQFEQKPSKTLLDVGCGTGEHLKYLSQSFQCKGIDISTEMIKIARAKVADAEFEIADMVDFDLGEKSDVITCLFSSIGYVQTFRNLVRTLANFRNHLNTGGLTLVVPWVFKKDFQKEIVSIDTYEDDRMRLVRMGTSKLAKSRWLVYFHYLIGTDGEIKHAHEVHKMLAADYEDYLRAFSLAGYSKPQFLKENQWTTRRGLFVALK
jgi:cyclopropane fatty-acyl-phospholipid synthase-like methyltransferase